jgi:hypothetical protein
LFDPAGPTSSEFRPINQPLNPLPPFSRRQTGPACRSTTHPHPCFPHLGSVPHQASHAAAARVRDGTLSPSGRPARRGTGARSCASRNRPGREIPLLPRATHLCILACAKGSGAASAARAVKAGAAWGFHLDICGARVQKQGRRLRPRRPSYQPPLGFSLSSSPEGAS